MALLGAMSVAIETIQFLGGARAADIDDVILNATGALLGALAGRVTWRLVEVRLPRAGLRRVGDDTPGPAQVSG